MLQKRIDIIREKLANIEKEMEDIEKERQDAKLAAQPSPPPRHGQCWTEYEKENVIEALSQLADKYAIRYGRTKLSIVLFVYRHIGKGIH